MRICHLILILRVSFFALVLNFESNIASHIPQDVEILEGYEFDESPEYYATDNSFYEARALLSGLNKSIRNKRSILEYEQPKAAAVGAGGVTTRETNNSNAAKDIIKTVDSDRIEVRQKSENDYPPLLPKAEKQVMDPDYDYYSQRRLSNYNDAYATPIDYKSARPSTSKDDDNMPDASTNYITRSRQARVNFITQPKKENEPSKELPEPSLTKVPVSHLKPYHYDDTSYNIASAPTYVPPYNYDIYPSRSYDPYLRRYDRFDEQFSRYDPYNYDHYYVHRRHHDPYDSYSPRMPQYPEPYYNYPDRRYDIPEPRDYVPLYDNNIVEKGSYASASFGAPPAMTYAGSKYPDYSRGQRRFVYYAHLPEIVRTPYDYPSNRYDRDHYDGLLNLQKPIVGAYKMDKSNSGGERGSVGAGGGSTDLYDYVKRDKKDRSTPTKSNKGNTNARQ